MDLMLNLKKKIDNMSYEEMLRLWRFAKPGDLLFIGESGIYFKRQMFEKSKNVDTVLISKKVGWEK
jgi:zona occludens toxin (predicted ATPase)